MQNIVRLTTVASNSSAVYFNGVHVFRKCVSSMFASYCCIDLALHLLHIKAMFAKPNYKYCSVQSQQIQRVAFREISVMSENASSERPR